MSEVTFTRLGRVVDYYGNQHQLSSELARGGQGIVYRTLDADLAVKQPLAANGEVDRTSGLQAQFQKVRCLPLPPRIPVSLPLATLRDEPGYVMKLLSDMKPFAAFGLSGEARSELGDEAIPGWLAGVKDKNNVLPLMHYARSGSTKRRLLALGKVAGILARLHAAGLVYGDISPNNCFIGDGGSREVWLIDADNLRFEFACGGSTVYTPRYGAPEIVQGTDQSRPRTDCWAFAVMAFETLALVHPFIGKKVLDLNNDESGWDDEPAADTAPADLDEQAYAGYLAYVDDQDDDSNRALSGLSRELVLTPQLARLFQETFGAGLYETVAAPVDGVLGAGTDPCPRPVRRMPQLRHELPGRPRNLPLLQGAQAGRCHRGHGPLAHDHPASQHAGQPAASPVSPVLTGTERANGVQSRH